MQVLRYIHIIFPNCSIKCELFFLNDTILCTKKRGSRPSTFIQDNPNWRGPPWSYPPITDLFDLPGLERAASILSTNHRLVWLTGVGEGCLYLIHQSQTCLTYQGWRVPPRSYPPITDLFDLPGLERAASIFSTHVLQRFSPWQKNVTFFFFHLWLGHLLTMCTENETGWRGWSSM